MSLFPPPSRSPRHRLARVGAVVALIAAGAALGGCGSSSTTTTTTSAATTPTAAVTAPTGFQPASCVFLRTTSKTACYRRGSAVTLTPSSFEALVLSSGLEKPDTTPNCFTQRPHGPDPVSVCLGRANLAGVEYAIVAASALGGRDHAGAARPPHRGRLTQGSAYEVSPIAQKG